MDPTLLGKPYFWQDAAVCVAGGDPAIAANIPELRHHVLFQTSGSTGVPKWIALSKTALLISAAAVNRHLGVTSDSRWGLALPLHHVGGFGVAARAYEAACGISNLTGKWNPQHCRDWLESEPITHLSLVPTQVHDLVSEKLRAPETLRAIVVGGGHLDEATGRAARALGWPVLASYGMTEAGSQIATQGLDLLETPYQSAPIPLLPIWQARSNPDGLLEIHGDALFSGILGPDGYTPSDHDWHLTADCVSIENGQLTPLGRADTRVKVLGELVDPLEIERTLLALSDHSLSPSAFAIIAVPDPRSGHALVPVFDSSTPIEFIKHLLAKHSANAPGYERLREPLILAELPRSPLGKIRRAELTNLLINP